MATTPLTTSPRTAGVALLGAGTAVSSDGVEFPYAINERQHLIVRNTGAASRVLTVEAADAVAISLAGGGSFDPAGGFTVTIPAGGAADIKLLDVRNYLSPGNPVIASCPDAGLVANLVIG